MEAPLLVLFVLVLLPLALKSLGVFGLSQENIIILAMVLQQVGFLLGTFILKKRHPVHPTDILDTRFEWKAFWRSLLWVPAIVLINVLGIVLSTQLFTPLLGADRLQSILLQETSRVNIFLLSSWRLVVATIMVCVVGPISEELFFRGFFLSRAVHTYSQIVGYLLTSLFFVLPHLYLINSIPIFLLSLVLCYIALNENLWAAVGAHVFFNTVVFLNVLLRAGVG
jgi:membrane protease YdiL (CAAX protease family)